MALQVVLNRVNVYRILLEPRAEGVYINVFDSPRAKSPKFDWLAPNINGAQLTCKEEFGIDFVQWVEVPDEPWHAP